MLETTVFRMKSFISLTLSLLLLASVPLLTSCESKNDKLEREKQEQYERLYKPRKEKIDPRNAKNFDPYK